VVALDGAWYEQGGELSWQRLSHLQTSEVGAVLESTVRRIERHLRRRGLLGIDEDRVVDAWTGLVLPTRFQRLGQMRMIG
jgi:hypothetical protein